MKKLLLAIFVSVCFMSTSQAQLDVTLNPLGVLFGGLAINGDYMLSENTSVEGTFALRNNNSDVTDSRVFRFTTTGKYYFNPDKGADKFYADAFVRFVNRKYEWNDDSFNSNYKRNRIGVGFGAGYKVVSDSGFVFDMNFGIGRALLDKTKYDDPTGTNVEVDWINLMVVGKMAIGYRFGVGNN